MLTPYSLFLLSGGNDNLEVQRCANYTFIILRQQTFTVKKNFYHPLFIGLIIILPKNIIDILILVYKIFYKFYYIFFL